jgi:arabinan endo-1,5-alpha-L-arabinosidase
LLVGCGNIPGNFFHPEQAIVPPARLGQNPLRGDISPVHDPSMIRQGDTYYYITGDFPLLPPGNYLPLRCSADRTDWRPCGHIFDQLPDWVRAAVPRAIGLWAPDISYFHGSYRVYYAASSLGSQQSVIGLATNTTLNPDDPSYRWVDHGLILQSRNGDNFNAIDPNLFRDIDGKFWLTYGSYWSGIKQQQVNPVRGTLIPGSPTYSLAARLRVPDHSVEGASLIRHGHYYYLFASIDRCCEMPIERDNYKQVVGRGRSPHGPFIDQAGVSMRRGGGNVLLETGGDWLAPGGGSVYVDERTGQAFLAFHALKRSENGQLYLWIKPIEWRDGWPLVH